MDEAEEQRRWKTAQEFYQAATAALSQQHYRACAGLAYYACFQAMWVALSDPPTGRWQHGVQTTLDVIQRVRQYKFGEDS